MSETKINLGMLPNNRGNFDDLPSGALIYKDNIVQYHGSSYIYDPASFDIEHPELSATTSAPYDNDPSTLNTGWKVFASGNNKFSTGESVDETSIDSVPTVSSNALVTSGGVTTYTAVNGNAYDISAAHSGATYADLTAALGTDGENVPLSLRKGGMSVKFISTSDNNYHQFQLTSKEFNTIAGNWQEIDDKQIKVKLQGITAVETKVALVENTNWYDGKYVKSDGTIQNSTAPSGGVANGILALNVSGCKKVRFLGFKAASTTILGYGFSENAIDLTSSAVQLNATAYSGNAGVDMPFEYIVDVPYGMNYFACTIRKSGTPQTAIITIDDFYCYVQTGSTVLDDMVELQKGINKKIGYVFEDSVVWSTTKLDAKINIDLFKGNSIKFAATCSNPPSSSFKVYVVDKFNNILADYDYYFGEVLNINLNDNYADAIRLFLATGAESGQNVNVTITQIGSLEQDVSSIEREINGEYEESDERISPNTYEGYYNTNGVTVGSTYNPPDYSYISGFKCKKLNVSEGEKYKIKVSHGGASSIRCYVITDVNNVVTRLSTTSSVDEKITISNGESHLFVNWTGYDESVDGLWLIHMIEIYQGIKPAIANINKQVFPLQGKTIVCFGDSITEYKYNGKGYVDYIADATSANIINLGIGGTRLQERETPSATPYGTYQAWAAVDMVNLVKWATTEDYTILDASVSYLNIQSVTAKATLLKSIDWSQVDIVTFFGGTNDFRAGQQLGTQDSANIKTTLGAINYIIENLLTAYPHIHIYWFTPTVRWIDADSLAERTPETWSDVWENGENKTLVDYKNAIIDVVSTVHHTPICDLYDGLGWNKYNFANYFNDNDGTHPYKGFKNIANKILSFILGNEIW